RLRAATPRSPSTTRRTASPRTTPRPTPRPAPRPTAPRAPSRSRSRSRPLPRRAHRRSVRSLAVPFVVEVLQILVVQTVSELRPLGGQIPLVLSVRLHLDRHLLDHREPKTVDA